MSSDWHIRPLDPNDQALLREAIYHAIFVPPGQAPPPRAIVENPAIVRYVENWGRTDDFGLAAIAHAGAASGVAWIRLLQGNNRGYGYVDDGTPELSIAVWPGHRGQGIGTRLLSTLVEYVETRWQAISLSVSTENPALRLYRRMGFEVVAASGTSLTMVRRRGI